MKRYIAPILVAFGTASLLLAIATPAGAISRISSIGHTCADLRGIIGQRGAVLVTHPGTRSSGTLYDRYVSDSGYCSPGYVAAEDWVPAKDRDCRLSNCQIFEPPLD